MDGASIFFKLMHFNKEMFGQLQRRRKNRILFWTYICHSLYDITGAIKYIYWPPFIIFLLVNNKNR